MTQFFIEPSSDSPPFSSSDVGRVAWSALPPASPQPIPAFVSPVDALGYSQTGVLVPGTQALGLITSVVSARLARVTSSGVTFLRKRVAPGAVFAAGDPLLYDAVRQCAVDGADIQPASLCAWQIGVAAQTALAADAYVVCDLSIGAASLIDFGPLGAFSPLAAGRFVAYDGGTSEYRASTIQWHFLPVALAVGVTAVASRTWALVPPRGALIAGSYQYGLIPSHPLGLPVALTVDSEMVILESTPPLATTRGFVGPQALAFPGQPRFGAVWQPALQVYPGP